MDPPVRGVWRRAVARCVVIVLLLLVLTDSMVARGEFVHKNLTEADTTSPSPAVRRGGSTESTQGEARCHCNLPRCVTQGYMCKSTMGACFTRNTPAPTHAYTHARNLYHRWAPMHGCVELLPENRQGECVKKAGVMQVVGENGEGGTTAPTPPEPDPDLTCCSQDMCNYRDIDVYIQVDGSNFHSQTDMKKHRDSNIDQVWFRAATIAVPIAGGFILIVLVLLAGKMLAKENKRQRMAQVLGERYLKAPLYPVVAAAPLHHHHHHHPLCYHPHSSKTPDLPHLESRNGYQDNPSHYRPHEQHDNSPEELKPLNTTVLEMNTVITRSQIQCYQPE